MVLYILTNLIKSNTCFVVKVDLLLHSTFSHSLLVSDTGQRTVQCVIAFWASQKNPRVTLLLLIELENLLIAIKPIVGLSWHDAIVG